MGVDLGRLGTGVAQNRLDDSLVRPALQEVGAVAVL